MNLSRVDIELMTLSGGFISNYIMAYEYSNVILFYCFANKLIAVTEKINDMISIDNIYQTLPLSNALLNYLQK